MSESSEAYNEAIEALIKGTDFKLSSKSEVLNQRPKVSTPIEALNCILGGGLPFGTVFQSYGPPKAGKSTWLYQTMGNFQVEYPQGVSVVIDMEASADGSRLEFLGVDTSKVLRLPASSIESGFVQLLAMLENKASNKSLKSVPVFVIWDTISHGLAQDGSTQSRMNAQDRARIIKNYLSPVMAEIEKQDFILGLLNQVIYTTDSYGNKHMDSGGGIAIKHDAHFSTKMEIYKGGDSSENGFLIKRISKMDIDKSKIGPEVSGIPVIIDITEGGSISVVQSFTEYMMDLGFFNNNGGWYTYQGVLDNYKMDPFYKVLVDYNKKYRYAQIHEMMQSNPIMYNTMRHIFMKYFSSIYKLQSKIIEPYSLNCDNDIRKEYDPAELYLVNNEEKINSLLEELKNDSDRLNKIKASLSDKDTVAVCLDCGDKSDNLGVCNCGCARVVSRKVAESLINKLECSNETVATE